MDDDEALARALQDLEYRNQAARVNTNNNSASASTPNSVAGISARRVERNAHQPPPPQAQARLFPIVTGTAIPATTTTTTTPGREPPASSSSSRRSKNTTRSVSSRRSNPPQDPPATIASSTARSKNSVGSRKSNSTNKSSSKKKATSSSTSRPSSSATEQKTMANANANANTHTVSPSRTRRQQPQQQQPQQDGLFATSLDNLFPSSQTTQSQQQQTPTRSKSKTAQKSKSSRNSQVPTAPLEPSPGRNQRSSSRTPSKKMSSNSSKSSAKRSKSATKLDRNGSGTTATTLTSTSGRSTSRQLLQPTVAALPPNPQQQQQARSSRSTQGVATTGTARSSSRSRGVPQQQGDRTPRQLDSTRPPPTNPAATRNSNTTANTTPQRATVIPLTLPPPPAPTPPAPTAKTMSDEEYARQLSQQFRNENGIQPSPPDSKHQASTVVIGTPLTMSHSEEKDMTDEEYARKLAQEYRSGIGIPPSPTSVASLEDVGTIDDAEDLEKARRIAQELEDEELAMRMTQADLDVEAVQRIARAEARRGTNQGYVQSDADLAARAHQAAIASGEIVFAQPPPQPLWKRILRCFMPIGVFFAVALGLWFAFGGSDGAGWPGLPSIGAKDPFDGVNLSDTNQWENSKNKNGLRLEVLDGLDQEWEGLFHIAMSDWENGTPDALSLIRKDIGYDAACDHPNMKMKVCNGDYDDTGWRGINRVLINDKGWIISSVALVNDFYLKKADINQRRYTMCHEIGHGFGLPHTDENFFNKDLGNCMDYTNRPENNLTPDESNFNLLAEWYGEAETQETRRTFKGDENEASAMPEKVPESVWVELKEAVKVFEKGNIHDMSHDISRHTPGRIRQWEVIHQSSVGEARQMELSAGYTIKAHFLYAEPLV